MALNKKEQYLDAWSALMIDYWIEQMDAQLVGISGKKGEVRYSSGELRRSFSVSLLKQSGGDTAKIDHMFNYYGMYLDGGVFPGRKGSGGENYISNPNRTPKPWRSLKYWYSQRRLHEKMIEFTGMDYIQTMTSSLTNFEKKQ